MNDKNKQIISAIIVILVLIVAGYSFYNNLQKETITDDVQNVDNSEISDDKNVVVSIDEEGNVSTDNENIEIVPVDNTSASEVNAPDLDKPIVFYADISQEVKDIMTSKIENTIKDIKAKQDYFSGWISLGVQYKIIGDYDSARDAWEYASAIRPASGLPNRNLGDLYGYYLKDNIKAEENLLKAIEKSPNKAEYYLKTAEFYRDIAKDIDSARNIIQQGITTNPTSEDLKSFLISLE